jgi:hypothetical protein
MTLRSSHTAVVVSRFKILGTKTVTLKGYFEFPTMHKCNFNNQLQIDSTIKSYFHTKSNIIYTYIYIHTYTRWFKYDRDCLCVNKSQFVPVIFEPPCINIKVKFSRYRPEQALGDPVG